MNGYSEASIVCGGNIGDPGFYLYLANVKQKLQKILRTDREDLLIEKVERWNSVRVTFRLPPSSANILRSLAEQRPDSLRTLGIHSVQVDAGRLVSLVTGSSQSADGATAAGSASSTTLASWKQCNVNYSNLANAASSSSSISGEGEGNLLTLVDTSSSGGIGNAVECFQNRQEKKRSIVGQTQQTQCTMIAKEVLQHQTPASQQQQNILGYLLDEPDQPMLHQPPPPPYQDYQQQRQAGSFVDSASTLGHVQQDQRWQQQQQQPQASVGPSWNPSSTVASIGQPMPGFYYAQQNLQFQQQSPHPVLPGSHQHSQYMGSATAVSVANSQQDPAMMTYPAGVRNSSPAYQNVNQHQQSQQNPGNVSNSPLLVGLLQQNSPPPTQQPPPSFPQPHPTPLFRNSNAGNLSGYNNELIFADSSPPVWGPVAAPNQVPAEPVGKKQKRIPTSKPKKTPGNNPKNTSAKKTASKRAGALTNSDGSSMEPSITATFTLVADQDTASHEQNAVPGNSASTFNRDSSISSVIDSVLCNVTMAASAGGVDLVATNETARHSVDSPTNQVKSSSSVASVVAGSADETGSRCGSTPMSTTSFSIFSQHQRPPINAMESPVQHSQRQQQLLRSVSSSSSSSSPLVSSASPTFDTQWQQQQRPGNAPACPGGSGITSYGAYQNHPNHQFIRHHPYQQHQEAEAGLAKVRRQPMPRQGPRFAQSARFSVPVGTPTMPRPYPSPQTTFDLAHHDNNRTDCGIYSNPNPPPLQPNSNEPRNSASATVNGDIYSSSVHPAGAVPRHALYHGQQVSQQHEQYGASGSWTAGERTDRSAAVGTAVAPTADFMISSKATAAATVYGMSSGGADHDYLVVSSAETSSNASFGGDQLQTPIANDFYDYTASQQHRDFNYGTVGNRTSAGSSVTTYYNGGGGDEQRMQEALVARHGSAYIQQHSAMPHWDKQQQQRLVRHRQPWTPHPNQQQTYNQQGMHVDNIYDDDSIRDAAGSLGSSPLDGFSAGSQQRQALISTASTQRHNHGVSLQQQQQQQSSIDDPMLSGQVPAR